MTREEKYIENFSQMIKKETISAMEEHPDITKFIEFHELLRKLFPNIFGVCEFEEFEGSFLMKWSGSHSTCCDSQSKLSGLKGNDDKNNKNEDLPVCFMNHHDVVEATGEWEHEPFSGEVFDGKLWGRGTLDTKGGLFAMLQAADELAGAGFKPKRDIYFESACTEETTGLGADLITDELVKRGIRFEMTFDEGGMAMYDPIGGADGTFAMVGLGEKGCCDLKFIAKSNGGHASTPGRNTPLVRLGKFMAEVEKKDPFEREINPVIEKMFKTLAPYMGGLGFIMKNTGAFGWLIKAVMPKISPTAGAMLKTTLAFTMAQGSNGTNVLPQEAFVIGNMRFSHHEGRDAAISKIKPIADKYDIEIEIMDPGFSSRLTDPNGTAFRLTEEAVKASMPNVDKCVPYVMTGASDSRYFDKVCDQCIRFLPFTITEEQMESIHGLNECVDVSSIVPAVDFYTFLMKKM